MMRMRPQPQHAELRDESGQRGNLHQGERQALRLHGSVGELHLQAQPLHEEGALLSAGLDALDVGESPRGHAGELSRLHRQQPRDALGAPVDLAQRGELEGEARDDDRGEPGIEAQHQREEEDGGDEVQHEVREVGGDRLRELLVQLHARGDLARRALDVEVHRQRERVREEALRGGEGCAREGGGEHLRLHPRKEPARDRRDEEPREQRLGHPGQPRRQHLVDEAAHEPGECQPRRHEYQAEHDGDRDRAPQAGHVPRERAQHRGRLAAGREFRPALEREHHAGESLVELRGIDPAPAHGRVVQVRAAVAEALEDDEVVEVPEEDGRQRQRGEVGRLLAKAPRHEPVAARRTQQSAGLAAVARHAAVGAQHLQRHVAAVVGEHHRERGRAALHRLDLQDGRDAGDGGVREDARGRGLRCRGVRYSSHALKAITAMARTASTAMSQAG